jgi:hypothetical protein
VLSSFNLKDIGMHNKMKSFYFLFFACLFSLSIRAQHTQFKINTHQLLSMSNHAMFKISEVDTIKRTKSDSTKVVKKQYRHNPKLAIILSTVVPGAGQIYNKKYWKTPIVLAGIGVCGYFIRTNHILYKDYKGALLQRVDTNATAPDKYLDIYSNDQLITLQDQYRQNRDLFIIVTSLVYVLNIVDALVDAHLFSFDVSDDLSLNWQPYCSYTANAKGAAGLSFQLKF